MNAPARQAHRRDSVATRARIEKESLRLFAEKGVDGATIRDIAQAVGVADAALYRYYPSKEEIARDIFTRHYSALAEKIRDIDATDASFPEKVAALVELLCDLFDNSPDVFTYIMLNQHAHLRYVGMEGNVVEELRLIMVAAHARGDIAIADPDLAAAIALGAVLQPAVFKLYGRLPGTMASQAATLTKAALSAIRRD